MSKEDGEAWKPARFAVLTESEVASPLADVPPEVARRAGHSIAVLVRFYAKAVHRNQQQHTGSLWA
ncbi:hypothetical protein ACWD46_25785 [Streptomyces sp. NPDC002486]